MELIEGISHNMIDVFHDGVHSTYVGNGPVISQACRNKLPGDNHGDLPCVVSTEIMAGMPDQILEITVAASKGTPDQILFANTPPQSERRPERHSDWTGTQRTPKVAGLW